MDGSRPCLHRQHATSNKEKTRAALDAPPLYFFLFPTPFPTLVYGYVTTGLTTSALVWLTVAPTPLMT